MNQIFYSRLNHLRSWTQQAVEAAWLNQSALERLNAVEHQDTGSLFVDKTHRPLIVAFFGGTGAGKSSLLNRLAGENITRVGVERPTSHEVSLYLHQDFKLSTLPAELPLEKTQVSYHEQPNYKLLAWLDMPDVDSATIVNRELAQLWLPYVDYLVYVVTPDRYLDDSGWQILKAREDKHHLLFVMNHWDQAQEIQLTDFKHHLEKNGIVNPTILRTSCKKPYIEDDFFKLTSVINQAIKDYGLELLQTLGIKARLDELTVLQTSFLIMLEEDKWQLAKSNWDQTYVQHLAALADNLEVNKNVSIAKNLKFLKFNPNGFWDFLKLKQQVIRSDTAKIICDIWQERNSLQLKSLNLSLQNDLQQAGLSYQVFSKDLQSILNDVEGKSKALIDEQLNLAWLKPGTVIRRVFYKLFGFLSWALPLSVAIWSLYHLASIFYLAAQDKAEYLESNFISHSLMLIFISWLVPKILHAKLKPSIKSTLSHGLTKGVAALMDNLNDFYQSLWQEKSTDRQNLKKSLKSLSSN